MRILFLSNYFPPYTRGGYELWCQEVAMELVERGHQVSVLTARVPQGTVPAEANGISVQRRLHLEVEAGLAHTIVRLFKDRRRLEKESLKALRETVADFQPDVALTWGMWNVPRAIPAMLEELLPNRAAYYLCDYWLSYPSAYVQRWQEPSRRKVMQLPKQWLGKIFLVLLNSQTAVSLRLEHPICVSRAVRHLLVEAGIPVDHARIIYGGTKTDQYLPAVAPSPGDKGLKLLYLGRLEAVKGVHTALRAVALLAQQGINISLDVYGRGEPDYEEALRRLILEQGLQGAVSLCGAVDRAGVPGLLARYDALIFPSEWPEPFARTVLEAMAAGLPVIGTTTGGTGEILAEGRTGFTFPVADAGQLAYQIRRLSENRPLLHQVGAAGRRFVVENFRFAHMVDELEAALKQIHGNGYYE
jgi:glycogen synthase